MQRAAQRPGVEPGEVLRHYYTVLLRQFGPQGWWPARTRLEVILGAILVQNTSWRNAALAIERLRKAGFIEPRRISRVSLGQLEALIRPAGYFRQKARAIQRFIQWLEAEHQGSLDALFAQPPQVTRGQLLERWGLGAETADAILLYAGKQPFFVADAYTRRILARHGLISPGHSYAEAQNFLHHHLPVDADFLGEFHALLVETGKRYCRRQATRCEDCPLRVFLTPAQRRNLSRQLNIRKLQNDLPVVPDRESSRKAYASR